MITARDSEFHPVPRDNWRWTETTPLSFSAPAHGILGNLYIAARPNLGVALSTVGIVQGFRFNPCEVDFTDAQMHLPCPDRPTRATPSTSGSARNGAIRRPIPMTRAGTSS